MWVPLLEKAWAKTHGTYENIEGGDPSEAFGFLFNSPSLQYTVSSLTLDTLWNVVSQADKNNKTMTLTILNAVTTSNTTVA